MAWQIIATAVTITVATKMVVTQIVETASQEGSFTNFIMGVFDINVIRLKDSMPNTIKFNIDLVVDGKHQVVQATTDVRMLGEEF